MRERAPRATEERGRGCSVSELFGKGPLPGTLCGGVMPRHPSPLSFGGMATLHHTQEGPRRCSTPAIHPRFR
jgi:hypothetical protein